MTYKILMCCYFGASTSVLKEKMDKAILENNYDMNVTVTSIHDIGAQIEKGMYNMILLGPQVAYKKRTLANTYASSQIEVMAIDADDYGIMDGENIIKKIVAKIGK